MNTLGQSIRHLLLLLLGVGCGIIERPEDTGASSLTQYTGEERYRFAYSPGTTDCTLIWTASGTPAPLNCPSCVFAFNITFTFQAEDSVDNGACQDRRFSFQETYVLVQEGGTEQLALWNDSAPEIIGSASFAESTGQFRYSYGDPGYTYGSYYYTQYTYGSAQIQ